MTAARCAGLLALALLGAGTAARAEPAAAPGTAALAAPTTMAAPRPDTTMAASPPATGYEVPAQIFVVDAQRFAEEEARNRVIETTRQSLLTTGRAPLYAPARPKPLALREAALEALRRNLDIRRSGLAKAMAERALIEADAVFDPVFVATMSVTATQQFRRIEHPDRKFKVATERVPVGSVNSKGMFRCTSTAAALSEGADRGNFCHVITFPNRSAVSATQFTAARQEGYYGNNTVDANKPSSFAPQRETSYAGGISILQQLPWGPSLNLSMATRYQNKYYPLNTLNGLGETFGNYNRPYFTTLSVGASLPLPFTRNFGPTSAGDLGVDLARHRIDAAELNVRSVINDTLLQVDLLYWQLVGLIGALETTQQSLDLAGKQRASFKRLLDQGLITASDLGQADAQISRLLTQQQQLFGQYVTASETVRRLLDSRDEALLVPVGYQALFGRPAADLHESDRVLNNPLYQRQAVAVRLAGLVRASALAQTRPDLSLSLSATAAECCTFGYHDIVGSVSRAFTTQDQFSTTVSALYRRPIGNRAARAQLDQADHSLTQQAMALHEVELERREAFETARGSLASARERVRLSERNVRVAQEMYSSALTQQDSGLVFAYETIARLESLADARGKLWQARVDQRIAESQLLAAVGGLAERYGDLTAQTAVDRARLALLRQSGALTHFGGPL